MIWLLLALGVVIVLWLLSVVLQKKDKVTREKVIREHLEEKKKEEEEKSKSPFME